MHALGVITLTICPILIGLTYSITLVKNQRQIGKIIQLINWFKTEIRYQQTDLGQMLAVAASKDAFSSLEFLGETVNHMERMPFPKAWRKAVLEWDSKIGSDDKELIATLSDVLGASDVKGQLNSLEHICTRFESSLNTAKKLCDTKGKLSKSLGVLAGLAVCVLML